LLASDDPRLMAASAPVLSPDDSAAVARPRPGLLRAAGGRDPGAPRVPRGVIGAAAVGAVVALWQLAGSLRWVDPLLLPPPTEILRTTVELLQDGYRQVPLWEHVAVSVGRALLAFVAAIASGIPLGLAMGLSPTLSAALDPFVQFLRPLPKIALIPLAVVWFGIGELSKFFLIYIACVLSVVVGAAAAVETVPQARVRAAQALGATRLQVLRLVVLPNALGDLFTTVRLSVGIGWTALIAAELVAANSGLGWMVLNAGTYLRTDIVMLGILLLGATGYLFDVVLVALQRRFVPWAGRDA
jgi:taurine transport system permease protein